VALLLVVIAAWPIYLVWYGNSKLTHMDALSGAANTPGTTYLIVGSDKRTAEQAAEQDVKGQRADTIMLLQVPSSGSPALVSIPRDSWVSIPGYGDAKINAAYSYGGASLLVQTVENLTGMTIDHYVEVSMEGVKELTDAVGGVNLCLDYDVNDQLSGLVWQSGCHDADGTTALAFSRMRYSDPQGDIGRTERQRQVVSAILDKATTPGILLNPFKQRALVGAVAENLTTDTDTSIIDLAKAGLGMRSVMGSDGLMGIPPITTINYQVGGQSAVELDPDKIGTFFTKMMNGELTTSNFGQIN
jgi:cell envelope-related function transcriptional attenuator common domain